jgi:hypothetical protein
MNLLCRLGIHSYVDQPLPDQRSGDLGEKKRCRRCGRHFRGFLALDQSTLWGGKSGITVGVLKAAMDGVPDDVEVEIGSDALLDGGWAGADSAYLTTKRIALATDSPETVPVFRIAGWERTQGVGYTPGIGT